MASAQAIRADRASVEPLADDSKLARGLRRAERRLKAFGASGSNAPVDDGAKALVKRLVAVYIKKVYEGEGFSQLATGTWLRRDCMGFEAASGDPSGEHYADTNLLYA